MIAPKICFLAEGVIRDGDSNLISVFNILENLISQGFPLFVQRMVFFVLWERTGDDPEVAAGVFNVRIDGELLATRDFGINFRGGLINRTIVRLHGLVIPRPGNLVCQVVLGDDITATYSLPISAQPAEVVQQAEG